MNTNKMTQEQISALADGELDESQVEATLAALRLAQGREAWETYHQIGDVLRSDDMAVSLSPGFEARMAARLAAEPVILAPATANSRPTHNPEDQQQEHATAQAAPAGRSVKRWALSGTIAAAAAAAAFMAAPPLLVANKGKSPAAPNSTMVASASDTLRVTSTGGQGTAPESDTVILRDPRIDEYLAAHQRFSPSPYHTAHYARSATSAADSNK